MATITVLDSVGASQTIAKVGSTGSTTGANSLPVVIASDQGAITTQLPATLGIKAAASSMSVTQATEDAARFPASLGSKADASSFPVTQSTEDKARQPASLGSKVDASSFPVTQSTEDKAVLAAMSAKLPASLGIKAAASSLSVTQATEDAARFPASLGSKADAASFPVTQSTEDKVIFAATNTKLDTIHTDLTTANTQLPLTVSGTVSQTITRPANATPYTANDVLGGVLTIATGMSSGQRIMIAGVDLQPQISAIPASMTSFRVYFYDTTPGSAIADNSPWDLPSGDRGVFLGYVDVGTPVDLGSTCFVQVDNVNKVVKLNGSSNIFAYLVTNGGFTPAANSEVYLLRVQFIGL